MSKFDLITIIGPTASGKTSFACQLAYSIDSEIISGDSRQVYKMMDIGTGKDLKDYTISGKNIPYHLIDIRNAGEKYNIYEYQHDFHKAYSLIKKNKKTPILCGGSGLYIESVLKGYALVDVPENKVLRQELAHKNLEELILILKKYKKLHNTTDVDTVQRAIRAIEIEMHGQLNPLDRNQFEPLNSLIIGVEIEREIRRKRISERLETRLQEGMIEEIKAIIASGVSPLDLIYYGLEYKFVTQYILKELTYNEMFTQLEIAIHQFAKRQMTWFRGMEKRGLHIHWINGNLPDEEKIALITKMLV